MSVLYVASDGRGAGRTSLAAGLAGSLTRSGGASVAKPLYLSEGNEGVDPDVDSYRRAGLSLETEPLPVSERDLANGLSERLRGRLDPVLRALASTEGTVVVEGLPGSRPDGATARASAGLAGLLDARVLLVVGYTPDLSAASVAEAREVFGDRLLGVVLNVVTRYQGHRAQTLLAPAIEDTGVPVLGTLPEDRRLLGARVRDVAEVLGGEFLLLEEKRDELVEHVMIGCNVLDESTLYFEQRQNKAVLVRGGRPDIQMGALNTSTACVVLTAGEDPVQYIQYEAEQEEIPLIRTSMSTLQAAEAVGSLLERARFDHPRKLERMQELLGSSLNWEALRASL